MVDQIQPSFAVMGSHTKKTISFDLSRPDLHQLFDEFIDIMLRLLAYRDHSTYLHSLRVAEMSKRIGQQLGLSESEIISLEHGGLVHDIGKLTIPDDVLLKPGRFTCNDRLVMNIHPGAGARLFATREIDERITDIMLSHHERLDGSGYPHGISGGEISLYARIVAVADVFEALITARPYKKAHDRAEALDILRREARSGRLDHDIVELLVAVTGTWSPLFISDSYFSDHIEILERFRKASYFKEPLSRFYNYRYLLKFDRLQQKCPCKENGYSLIVVSFNRLKKLNSEIGYVKTDEIIEEVGLELLAGINGNLQLEINTLEANNIILKKGADYLIYCPCVKGRFTKLLREVEQSLVRAADRLGIAGSFRHRSFDRKYPLSKAVDQLFSANQVCSH